MLAGVFVFTLRFTCKSKDFPGGPAWTRTRDLFLIRDNCICSGCSPLFKSTCKPLLFTSMIVPHIYCCLGALSSNCRLSSDLHRTGQAIQQLYGVAPKFAFDSELHNLNKKLLAVVIKATL